MSIRFALAASAALLIPSTVAVAAQKGPRTGPPPAAFTRLTACQAIKDSAGRLACYDREVAAMSGAQARGDLVMMDRQQVRRTRRSLFGLSLPDLGVFGDDAIEGEAAVLETTIKAVRQTPDRKWIFDLVEGGRWLQIDSREFIVDPAPGQPIRIRRGMMASYLANVNKQIAVRVRRIQ